MELWSKQSSDNTAAIWILDSSRPTALSHPHSPESLCFQLEVGTVFFTIGNTQAEAWRDKMEEYEFAPVAEVEAPRSCRY